MRTQKSILLSIVTIASLMTASSARAIENDPDKEYHLTEKHGPWMIMVASFRNIEAEDRKIPGLTAEKAANKLVHELRGKGIPAYVFSQEWKRGTIESFDRVGNKNKRAYAAQREMICVLAGNYPKIDDPVAQKTLAYIKKMRPKFMEDPKSGAVVRDMTGTQKGPFGGAFLSINPQLDPNEVVVKKIDPETKALNSGIDYPLVSLKRKYTLKIATFTGKSVVPMGNSKYRGREANFEKSLFDSGSYNLARAGEDATQLTYALRQNARASNALGRPKFEAYVYHDKYQSIVTVGGFDSELEPEIKRLIETFKPKYKEFKASEKDKSEFILMAETLSLPAQNANDPPIQTWVFDPVPELIEVPRLK